MVPLVRETLALHGHNVIEAQSRFNGRDCAISTRDSVGSDKLVASPGKERDGLGGRCANCTHGNLRGGSRQSTEAGPFLVTRTKVLRRGRRRLASWKRPGGAPSAAQFSCGLPAGCLYSRTSHAPRQRAMAMLAKPESQQRVWRTPRTTPARSRTRSVLYFAGGSEKASGYSFRCMVTQVRQGPCRSLAWSHPGSACRFTGP